MTDEKIAPKVNSRAGAAGASDSAITAKPGRCGGLSRISARPLGGSRSLATERARLTIEFHAWIAVPEMTWSMLSLVC
jgi:hypothetical protein